MSALYFFFYWVVVLFVCGYFSAMIIAVTTAILAVVRTSRYEVDVENPENEVGNKNKAILRKLEPFEILVIVKGGKPAYPLIDKNELRLTVEGLKKGGRGLTHEKGGQWKVKKVGEGEEYPEVIQSVWWYLSPLYTFRKIIYFFTNRHVVRVWFPFFISGLFELYEPFIMTFVRARSEKLPRTSAMTVIDDLVGCTKVLVQDKTDHLLYQSGINIITETLPTRDGFSIRADLTVWIETDDLFQIVAWKDWSPQINSGVNNAVGLIIRNGTLDSVYATTDEEKNALRDTIKKQFTVPDEIVDNVSLMEKLGFKFLGATLNDLIPANEASEKEIERIMSIVPEGRKKAEASGLMLQEQLNVMVGKKPEETSQLAAITAAQKSGGGKTDLLMNTGNSSANSETNDRLLAFLRRIEKKLDKGGDEE